ncbi:MAG: hypothetical protein H6704_23995 [Myxococcales bacterium]|nr:hypothetical protein [Myxococcales bacterium]
MKRYALLPMLLSALVVGCDDEDDEGGTPVDARIRDARVIADAAPVPTADAAVTPDRGAGPTPDAAPPVDDAGGGGGGS